MSGLINIAPRQVGAEAVETVNARELHAFLESKQQFADWIKARIEQYSFVEGQDFTVHKFMKGRASQTDYHFALDMTRNLDDDERGAQIVRTARGVQKLHPIPDARAFPRQRPKLRVIAGGAV